MEDFNRFSKERFLEASEQERDELRRDLAQVILAIIQGDPRFHEAVASVVSKLRDLGHDLWSYDEDDDMESWCPDWTQPRTPGLSIEFRRGRVDVGWG